MARLLSLDCVQEMLEDALREMLKGKSLKAIHRELEGKGVLKDSPFTYDRLNKTLRKTKAYRDIREGNKDVDIDLTDFMEIHSCNKVYVKEIRDKNILRLHNEGYSNVVISNVFTVSESTVSRVIVDSKMVDVEGLTPRDIEKARNIVRYYMKYTLGTNGIVAKETKDAFNLLKLKMPV